MASPADDDLRILRPCVGCLGSRVCWVCEGSGRGFGRTSMAGCSRCSGLGVCSLCPAAVPAPREHSVPAPRETVDL